jgi:hypothetical protein
MHSIDRKFRAELRRNADKDDPESRRLLSIALRKSYLNELRRVIEK